MKFYHSTRENVWKEIQEEGVLWGCNSVWDNYTNGIDKDTVIGMRRLEVDKDLESYRYTYLSPDLEWSHFGEVLLEVDYEPFGCLNDDENGETYDNFAWDREHGKKLGYCWQFSVFKPIPLSNVKRVDIEEAKKNFDWDEMYENLNKCNKAIQEKITESLENSK